MAEESKEKIEDIVNRTFTKGSIKALIAYDTLAKYKDTDTEISKEYRESLIEKYTQSKDTPVKARRRVADVISKLRSAGYYDDAYSRGEKVAVSAKKKGLDKLPSSETPEDPPEVSSTNLSITPSMFSSKPLIQGNVEEDIKEKTVSIPPVPETGASSPLNTSNVEQVAKELGLDLKDLQAFLEAKRKEKAKSEETRIQDLVDQRLKQLLNTGNPTGNPGSSPPPQISDADKVRSTMEGMSPAELRLLLKKKSGNVENPMLAVFQYMESETSVVDIMDEMGLDFEQIIDYQEKFNKMKELELERQQMNEPYLKAWFDIAQVIGENIRRDCGKYNEVNGVCLYWHLDDLSKTYREQFKGMYRSGKSKGGGYYIDVNKHPEVCAVCPIKSERSELI